ncbi:MAG: thioredoxin domain-containing protein [Patescibacteria group bacterium]
MKNKNKYFLITIFVLALIISGCSLRGDVAGEQDDKKYSGDLPQKVEVSAVTAEDHIQGNSDAPVTMIIYSDFECSFCAKFEGAGGSIEQAKEFFGYKLRIVFRHNPLPFHNYAQQAAEASECAHEQSSLMAVKNKFWQMHDLLFINTANNQLNLQQIYKNAEELDLDMDKFKQCLEDEKYKDKVLASVAEAKKIGANGTPTSFINGRIVVGAVPFEDYQTEYGLQPGLKSIINKVLEEVGK